MNHSKRVAAKGNGLVQRRLCAAILVAMMGGAMAAPVQAQSTEAPQSYTIPAGDLGTALDQLAEQANLQILFSGDLVRGKRAPALSGRQSWRQALGTLLEGSGLTWGLVDGTTVVIKRSEQTKPPERPKTLPPAEPSAALSKDDAEVKEFDKIVVVGSNIRGAINPTAPVIILDRDYIDSTGISTTSGLIESLPQNYALATQGGVQTPGVTTSKTQGASINLRGIGEGTTLVLLNGRRLALGYFGSAVDISAIPLSAIDRVEILTDGASALYGSDAVGGVVNIVLREDMDGAETRVRRGWASDVGEYRLGHAFGGSWESGNAMLGLEYYKRDLLSASKRDFVSPSSIIGSLYPEDRNKSVFYSANQDVGDRVTLFSNGLYAHRDSYNQGGRFNETYTEDTKSDTRQVSVTAGGTIQMGKDWQIEIAGNYASDDSERFSRFTPSISLRTDASFATKGVDLKADGPLFSLPSGSARMAVGVSWRREEFDLKANVNQNFEQEVKSLYTEVNVPLVSAEMHIPGINALTMSLAARYDNYSSFGSSIDPRVGLAWEPVRGLRIRGSYGTSYTAPKLTDHDLSANGGIAYYQADPLATSGISHFLQVIGVDVESLDAQQSKNISFGFDFRSESLPGASFSMNYYRIDFTGRIAAPAFTSAILSDPSPLGDLYIRGPATDLVDQYIGIAQISGRPLVTFTQDFITPDPNFTPDSVDVILDLRRRNLSAVDTSGLDVSANYSFYKNDNAINIGFDAAYMFEREFQVTPETAPVDTVDTYYNPPSLRARAHASWSRGGWSGTIFANYTDSYTDNRTQNERKVSSFTTVDLRAAYEFTQTSGLLSGTTFSISAQNLFNRNPPSTAVVGLAGDIGYDPTNASPMGRMVAVEVVKTW